ncbi:NGG1 interacting factor Nif3, putative [Trichophyton verrucosum HKI 0517]|uniref:NGG1 interacting factor Nif3, putative n=1 Tax=Trichophyton verrucosum (strain HKI 0517) TaxID=663202 RepID=D4D994_TRIVH|nr:NGG1 interacting factor Nif3, putative [Trichophyton verrucosum HKI 0517]EFE41586.1 NGG1 interacting factor Nif3, putative [Trichophyton verrucosum HKI 0517]
MATVCSPFSKAVVRCMQKLSLIHMHSVYHLLTPSLEVLLEAPLNKHRRLNNSVLLTVDLTKAVADEAIARGDSIIITYPVDATPGAMADWLCQCAVPSSVQPRPSTETMYPSPDPPADPEFQDAGMGRKITFEQPLPLNDIIDSIAKTAFPQSNVIGTDTEHTVGFSIAIPQGSSVSDITISSVAACPGSGSSILMKNGTPVADLLLTGELSHHEALAAIEAGSVVITLSHSNSERGFLQGHMRSNLHERLAREWREARANNDLGRSDSDESEVQVLKQIFADDSVCIDVSQSDRDPYQVVCWQNGREA